MNFMQAVSKMEGYGESPNNIPTAHNNPGDICAGQWANAHGAIPGAHDPRMNVPWPSRYAVFPNVDAGWAALRALLTLHYVGLTVAQAVARYAPATENDVTCYTENVCKWTGLNPGDALTAGNIG